MLQVRSDSPESQSASPAHNPVVILGEVNCNGDHKSSFRGSFPSTVQRSIRLLLGVFRNVVCLEIILTCSCSMYSFTGSGSAWKVASPAKVSHSRLLLPTGVRVGVAQAP